MEADIDNSMVNSSFGIEVEFYIVDQHGFPALESNGVVKNKCFEQDQSLNIVQELSSFQIEINPGPWPLNTDGLNLCLVELQRHTKILEDAANSFGWKLCDTLTPAKMTQRIIDDPTFFTKGERYSASARYFRDREAIPIQNLRFPGESIIGCINEIHIHAQLSNDIQTVALYNHLNSSGLKLIEEFNQSIDINACKIDQSITSQHLFQQANGEWNHDNSIKRVGNLPLNINSYQDYEDILNSFNKIPVNDDSFLDLESTVYFWTRLREKPGNLRVEFRPMEMGTDWIERVKYLYQLIKDFESECVLKSPNQKMNRM